MSIFAELSSVNVNEYCERKGKFTYLSWAFAVQELLKRYPEATWEMPEPTTMPDGTMLVWCKITVENITRTAYLPVMDNRNQPIPNPTAFHLNTAMQRCLAKAISLMGLGLYIYAGEDLPDVTDYDLAIQKLEADDPLAFREWLSTLGAETSAAVFNDAPKGEKVRFKERFNAEIKRADALLDQYAGEIANAIENGDAYSLAQLGDELTQYARTQVWARLTQQQRDCAVELKKVTG